MLHAEVIMILVAVMDQRCKKWQIWQIYMCVLHTHAPVLSAPLLSPPVGLASVLSVPVRSAPLESAPVLSSLVGSAPVVSAPVLSSPVQSTMVIYDVLLRI